MENKVHDAVQPILKKGRIPRETARGILDAPLDDLLCEADRLRRQFYGNRVALCAIVNARSGLCGEDCKFCAQSAHHQTGVTTYPMLAEEDILERARQAREMGARYFSVVTSGRRLSGDEVEIVCGIVRALRGTDGLIPCASLGELSADTARRLKDAGLSRYHHNLECAERFFPRVCATHGWRDRVRTVSAAKAAGLEVCAGGIFGLGENWEDRVDLALALRDLEVDSVPLNFLAPVRGTPYEFQPPLAAEDALRIIALFRIMLPRAEIRIAGGRELILGEMQSRVFLAGANGIMIGDYLTTKGRKPEDDLQMIEQLGLEIE
ncbi:MAG: biotin synthase BioB [Candidatus Aureabacteria bacterium]|nr:biotin synthase BioB [Candidatus Auribacterota bacterium]